MKSGSKQCPDCGKAISVNKRWCWDCAVKEAEAAGKISRVQEIALPGGRTLGPFPDPLVRNA